VIVVIGPSTLAGEGATATPDGLANHIAAAAVAAGASVELVAKIGDDPAGDALLVALARAGIGHVAVLRDAVHATPRHAATDDIDVDIEAAIDAEADGDHDEAVTVVEIRDAPSLDAADVDLALRYITEYRVLVVVHAEAAVVATAVAAADWAAAHLVVVGDPGQSVSDGLPAGSLALAAADEPDDVNALGARLGQYAAAVDGGADPAAAYLDLTATSD
jgi:sugar/nucleoside kinase (ribokinase family)